MLLVLSVEIEKAMRGILLELVLGRANLCVYNRCVRVIEGLFVLKRSNKNLGEDGMCQSGMVTCILCCYL